jgi:site-specific recombinase XerD
MTIRIEFRNDLPASQSPYRVVSDPGGEIEWVNRFLDMQRVRGVGELSLRQYGHWIVHFLRWWVQSGVDVTQLEISKFTEATLLDYVRAQRDHKPPPAVETINARTTMLRRLFLFHFNIPLPHSPALIQRAWWGLAITRRRRPGDNLRLRVPPRVIEPLGLEQVQRFWASFHTTRDIALVGLLLLNGLRSCEVLTLELEDLLLSEAQVRVHGKRGKVRLLPLAPETIQLLDCYVKTERPLTNSARVFVSLKGKARGKPMTKAGLRSLFRHHRAQTGVRKANPHRFRHTFGTDMIRAGVSLPALQRLMGHSDVETTMLYVQISPQDVYDEYARAVARMTGRARIAEP